MMNYMGTALLNTKYGRKLAKGDWIEIEIRELENYLKSWNEYEIVGLTQEC